MKYNFQGINPEILDLLSLNRFNDSKEFYEEHKEELKQGITIPMRKMILDLSGVMTEIDEKIDVNPAYLVSRIRRDTRFTKNKMLYRENLWFLLRRNKKEYPFAPFFWFEISSHGLNYGIAFWTDNQYQFDEIRKLIIEHPDRWLDAVNDAQNGGFQYNARDVYKKDRFDKTPDKLREYMNAKNMEFAKYRKSIKSATSSKIVKELSTAYKTLEPIYDFFIEAYENMIKEGLIK